MSVGRLIFLGAVLPAAILCAGLLGATGIAAEQETMDKVSSHLVPSAEEAEQVFLATHPWSSGDDEAEGFDLYSPFPDAPQTFVSPHDGSSRSILENHWFDAAAARRISTEPAVLLSPQMDVPQDLLPSSAASPEAVCDGLAAAGFPNGGWHRSEILAKQWECFSDFDDQVIGPFTAPPAPYSVFFILRGAEDGGLHEMRMKISLRDPAAAEDLSERTAKFMQTFATLARVRFPPVFVNAVINRQWAQYVSEDSVFTVAMEYGAEARYNVTAVFAPSAGKFLEISKGALSSTEWKGVRAN